MKFVGHQLLGFILVLSGCAHTLAIKQSSPETPKVFKKSVEIKSEPSGARIFQNKYSEGKVTGKYLLGTTPLTIEIEFEGQGTTLAAKFSDCEITHFYSTGPVTDWTEPLTNSLLFNRSECHESKRITFISEPSGADIEINNEYVGKTPVSYTVERTLPFSGTIEVRAIPNHYKNCLQIKELGETLPSKVFFQMGLCPLN